MRIVVNILVALLGGMAFLIASSMRLSMPADLRAHLQQPEDLDALPAPAQQMHDDSHALVSQHSFPLLRLSLVALYCTSS